MKLKPSKNKLNKLGVVVTGLVFGANVNANDPNEWERWDQNKPDDNKNQETIKNTNLPDDDSLGNGSNDDPFQANQNGDNNQNENKQTIVSNNNGSLDPTATATATTTTTTTTTETGWVIFGAPLAYNGSRTNARASAYAGAATSSFTFRGTFTPTQGGAPGDVNPGGAVALNLTDSNGKSTNISSNNAFVNLDAPFERADLLETRDIVADSRSRGTVGVPGTSSTGTGADFEIISDVADPNDSREVFTLQRALANTGAIDQSANIHSNNISPLRTTPGACTAADCTVVAAYGSIEIRQEEGGQPLKNTFFSIPGQEAATSVNNEFAIVAVERTADMSALSGVTNAVYTGRTRVFEDSMRMEVNFNASTFQGQVMDIGRAEGINLNSSGTITGNAFSANSLSVTGEGGGTATGIWEGNFGGPQAQAAAGRIDVDITTNTFDVNTSTGGTQNQLFYNDVFVIGSGEPPTR